MFECQNIYQVGQGARINILVLHREGARTSFLLGCIVSESINPETTSSKNGSACNKRDGFSRPLHIVYIETRCREARALDVEEQTTNWLRHKSLSTLVVSVASGLGQRMQMGRQVYCICHCRVFHHRSTALIGDAEHQSVGCEY